jgi:hypothetical protein
MISPFLAAAREKSPSELFPDQAGTKLKPEGEKSDRFARLLHRCEQRPKAPLTENSREDGHFPVQHTAFPVILRGVNGSVAGDAPSMENEGAEAALSGEGPDSLFSGEIPEEKVLSAEEALPFSGYLLPEGSDGDESTAAAAGMMVRNDVSLPGNREQEIESGPAEGKGTSALPAGSSPVLSPEEALPDSGA